MMRNDYRRSLILLRSSETGYSGHVRLERRTLMGSMYFLVQAPLSCTELRAALAGRNKSGYYACDLGLLKRDSRGQAVLSYSFDPRNICGRELEQYQLIVITCTGNNGCEIVLLGNVSGHADMDWNRLREVLCAPCGREETNYSPQEEAPPAARLPEEEETSIAVSQDETGGEIREEIREETEDIREDFREDALPRELPEDDEDEDADDLLEALGVDMDVPWAESIDPVRLLFANGEILRDAPDQEYIYISVPMPEESGYPYTAVGVLVENGQPVSVRYALPSAWTAEPPAGLEDYSWVGNQNRGWWMTQLDVYPQNIQQTNIF